MPPLVKFKPEESPNNIFVLILPLSSLSSRSCSEDQPFILVGTEIKPTFFQQKLIHKAKRPLCITKAMKVCNFRTYGQITLFLSGTFEHIKDIVFFSL